MWTQELWKRMPKIHIYVCLHKLFIESVIWTCVAEGGVNVYSEGKKRLHCHLYVEGGVDACSACSDTPWPGESYPVRWPGGSQELLWVDEGVKCQRPQQKLHFLNPSTTFSYGAEWLVHCVMPMTQNPFSALNRCPSAAPPGYTSLHSCTTTLLHVSFSRWQITFSAVNGAGPHSPPYGLPCLLRKRIPHTPGKPWNASLLTSSSYLCLNQTYKKQINIVLAFCWKINWKRECQPSRKEINIYHFQRLVIFFLVWAWNNNCCIYAAWDDPFFVCFLLAALVQRACCMN